jgi:hypothetical protein
MKNRDENTGCHWFLQEDNYLIFQVLLRVNDHFCGSAMTQHPVDEYEDQDRAQASSTQFFCSISSYQGP